MTSNQFRILDNGLCFEGETGKCVMNEKGSFEFLGKQNQTLQWTWTGTILRYLQGIKSHL